MSKALSIVIVTWNCKKYVQECLESMCEYLHNVDTEIIVVDNDSVDGTVQVVREHFPTVKLVGANGNLGFPRGTNLGLRHSTGRYVCLVNPDVRVLGGCIQKMCAYMDRNPRVGLLGPRMRTADGKPERSYMGAPSLWNLFCRALALDTLFPKSKLFGGFLMNYLHTEDVTEVDILNGWFWMTRRKAIEEVGLLDEKLFMYADDLDWSKRFRDCGWQVIYYPQAESIHYGGGTTARAPIRFSVEMQRANFQYWKKNYGRVSQLMYLATMALHQLVRLVGYSVAALCQLCSREEASFKLKRSIACLQWILGVGNFGRIAADDSVQVERSTC